MKVSKLFQAAATKYLALTVLAVVVVTISAYSTVLRTGVTTIDTLSKFVDAVFKSVAVLVGGLWTLNRYLVTRADSYKIRVDADIAVVRSSRSPGTPNLLLFRLDIFNTGTSLLPPFDQTLELEGLRLAGGDIKYDSLFRWPESGSHPGGPIEPASWSAINHTIAVAQDVLAVRVYLELKISSTNTWTWHKTFDVSGGSDEQ